MDKQLISFSVSLPTSPTEDEMVKSVEDFVPDNEGLDSSFLDDGKDVKTASKPPEQGETTDRYCVSYLLPRAVPEFFMVGERESFFLNFICAWV